MKAKENLRLLTPEEMARADQLTIESGTPGLELMENAGKAVASFVLSQRGRGDALVLAGPGNNGGDGLVAARHLRDAGWTVKLVLLEHPSAYSGDAAEMYRRWNGPFIMPELLEEQSFHMVIDALFGAGLSKPICGKAAELLDQANHMGGLKIAVDLPSGVHGATGQVQGSVFNADVCITFAAQKIGHWLYPGKEFCGVVRTVDIGVDQSCWTDWEPKIYANHPKHFVSLLKPISPTLHKYGNGHVGVIGGPKWRSGAARLSADAALRAGAGLVSLLAYPEDCDVYASHLNAVMLKPFDDVESLKSQILTSKINVLAMGPGLGVSQPALDLILSVLNLARPTVLDADALTGFAKEPDRLLNAIAAPTILTPHEGEFHRLFPDIERESKLKRAQLAAERANAVIVLKGADTVIAAPDGSAVINGNAPPNLATAGSGDILTGLIAGLLARGLPSFEASCAAVWIHGLIGQKAKVFTTADDMLSFIKDALLEL